MIEDFCYKTFFRHFEQSPLGQNFELLMEHFGGKKGVYEYALATFNFDQFEGVSREDLSFLIYAGIEYLYLKRQHQTSGEEILDQLFKQ
jgi:hypothetical protein